MTVMPQDMIGHAGHGGAGQLEVRRFDPGEIPKPRRVKAEMGVVRQDRFAGGAVVAVDGP